MDYYVDTKAVLSEVHRTLAEAQKLPPGEQRTTMETEAMSALSAILVYVREAHPRVLKKHYYAVQEFLAVRAEKRP